MNKEFLNKLKWYVLNHDFNKKEIVNYNIFNNHYMYHDTIKYLKEFITYDDFKEKVRGTLFYAFNSKAEYEIKCGGLLSKEDEEFDKISVYDQVIPNLDILCKYIINEWNNRPYARKEVN